MGLLWNSPFRDDTPGALTVTNTMSPCRMSLPEIETSMPRGSCFTSAWQTGRNNRFIAATVTAINSLRFVDVGCKKISRLVLPAEMTECNQCTCNNRNGPAKHEGPCRIFPVDKVLKESYSHDKDNDAAKLGLQIVHVVDV